MADSVSICDAVVSELNGNVFSQQFTAARKLLPEFELAELTDMKVTVVPKAVDLTPFSRQYTQFDHSIDIGIQKKLSGEVDTELPPLLTFVTELAIFLRNRKLAAVPEVVWVRCTNDPLYARDHLIQNRVFTSVLTITYRAIG